MIENNYRQNERFPKWVDIGILCLTVSFSSLPFLFGVTDVVRILDLHFKGKYSEAQSLSLIIVQLKNLPDIYWTCLAFIIAFWFGRGIMYFIRKRTISSKPISPPTQAI